MNFKELDRFYAENFSLGNLNPKTDSKMTSFEKKLELISLINYVYSKNKPKNPDLTHYAIILKLSDKLGLPDEFLKGLSIVCKDFGLHNSEFPTFGLEGKDIIKEIRGILSTYMPF